MEPPSPPMPSAARPLGPPARALTKPPLARQVQSFLRGWLCRRKWKTIIQDYIRSPHADSMRKRNQVVFSMLEAEAEYVQQLHILVNNFLRPLRMAASSKKPPITHDDVSSIFLNRWGQPGGFVRGHGAGGAWGGSGLPGTGAGVLQSLQQGFGPCRAWVGVCWGGVCGDSAGRGWKGPAGHRGRRQRGCVWQGAGTAWCSNQSHRAGLGDEVHWAGM